VRTGQARSHGAQVLAGAPQGLDAELDAVDLADCEFLSVGLSLIRGVAAATCA
jgi:hypothetical protein